MHRITLESRISPTPESCNYKLLEAGQAELTALDSSGAASSLGAPPIIKPFSSRNAQDNESGFRPATNLRKALIETGWQVIDTRSNPRAYKDAAGKRFGTLERQGVRVALSLGEELVDERGDVMVYMTDEPSDVVLRAIIVDAEKRRQGLASQTLQALSCLAETLSATVYLEPVPIDDKPLNTKSLANLYAKFGFRFVEKSNLVMVRRPQ